MPTPISVYIPVVLSLDVSANVIAQIDYQYTANTNYDYLISDSIEQNDFSIIDPAALSYFRYASSIDTTLFYLSADQNIHDSLYNSINLIPKYSTFTLDPTIDKNLNVPNSSIPNYPNTTKQIDSSNVDVTPTPGTGKLSDHYAAYMASLFFHNPNTQAPFSNLFTIESQMNKGIVNTDGSYNTLGDQFINFISYVDGSGNRPILESIFYQIMQDTTRFETITDVIETPQELNDTNTKPFPFINGDKITIDILISGNLGTEIPARNINFSYPTIGRLFKNRPDLNGSITPTPLTDTTTNIGINPKKWRLVINVEDKQDTLKQPQLIVTDSLSGNSSENFNTILFDPSFGIYNLLQKIYNYDLTNEKGSVGSRQEFQPWTFNSAEPRVIKSINGHFVQPYDLDLAAVNCLGYMEIIYGQTLLKNYYAKYVTSTSETLEDSYSFYNMVKNIICVVSNLSDYYNVNHVDFQFAIERLNNSFISTLLMLYSVKDISGNVISSSILNKVKNIFSYSKIIFNSNPNTENPLEIENVYYNFYNTTNASLWPNGYVSPFVEAPLEAIADISFNSIFQEAKAYILGINLATLATDLKKYTIDEELLLKNAINESYAVSKINDITTTLDSSMNIYKLADIINKVSIPRGWINCVDVTSTTVNMNGGTLSTEPADNENSQFNVTEQIMSHYRCYSDYTGITQRDMQKLLTFQKIINSLRDNVKMIKNVLKICSKSIKLGTAASDITLDDVVPTIDINKINVSSIQKVIRDFVDKIIDCIGIIFNPNTSEEKKVGSLVIILCQFVVSLSDLVAKIMHPPDGNQSAQEPVTPELKKKIIDKIESALGRPNWIEKATTTLDVCGFICRDLLFALDVSEGELNLNAFKYGCPNPIDLGNTAVSIGNSAGVVFSSPDPLTIFFTALVMGCDLCDFALLLLEGGNWNPWDWIVGLIEDGLRELANILLPYGLVISDGIMKLTCCIVDGVLKTIDELGDADFYRGLLNDMKDNLGVNELLKIKNAGVEIQVGLVKLGDIIGVNGAIDDIEGAVNAATNIGYDIKDGAVSVVNDISNAGKKAVNAVRKFFRI